MLRVWHPWTHRSRLLAVVEQPTAAAGSSFSAWQGGDAGVAGTGATAACAGTGADCTAAAAPASSRRQGRWQELSDDGDRSLPDLFVSSDDESVCDGGEVGLDELLSSEPVQPLRGASSADGVRSKNDVFDVYQGVRDVSMEQTYAECSASADAEWSWADVDALPTAPLMDWQPWQCRQRKNLILIK